MTDLHWPLMLLLTSLVAAVFGFGGIVPPDAAWAGRGLFVVLISLAVVTAAAALLRRSA